MPFAKIRPDYANGIAPGDYAVRTVTASGTLTDDDDLVLCDATLGNLTVTLPDPTSVRHKRFEIKKVDASANVISVAPPSGTLDGASSITISAQWESVSVLTNGTAWYIV